MEEVWKDIEGYEGLYEVSNLGRVKSLHGLSEKIMKNSNGSGGYQKLSLTKNKIPKNFFVHRLVAQAFIPNPESKPEVNHIDEDKTNNRVDNLEWMTHIENSMFGTRNERSSVNRLGNPKTGRRIKAKFSNGEEKIYGTIREASRQLGLENTSVGNHCRNKKIFRGIYFEYVDIE